MEAMNKTIDISKAPNSGLFLAYYRKKIVFEPYDKVEIGNELQLMHSEYGEMLELHMFDETEELRVIKSAKGYIGPMVIKDAEQPKIDTLVEEMCVENGRYKNVPDTIKVVNYLEEKKYGMIEIRNYRLAMSDAKEV